MVSALLVDRHVLVIYQISFSAKRYYTVLACIYLFQFFSPQFSLEEEQSNSPMHMLHRQKMKVETSKSGCLQTLTSKPAAARPAMDVK
jgi:hypothetical protein